MFNAMLEWRTLPYKPENYFVAHTELAAAYVPGTLSRFAIYETRDRPRVEDGKHVAGDVYYAVRDAYTVSDAQVREGKRPQVVARFDSYDDAARWGLARDLWDRGSSVEDIAKAIGGTVADVKTLHGKHPFPRR